VSLRNAIFTRNSRAVTRKPRDAAAVLSGKLVKFISKFYILHV